MCLLLLAGAQVLALPRTASQAAPSIQEGTPEEKAQALLEQLTPEERVGQLFLVTFQGQATVPESAIYSLIKENHIGGVVLSAENDNFIGPEDTLTAARELIQGLQEIEFSASVETQDTQGAQEPVRSSFIPLFIGLSQEGNGFPNDQILNGLTKLPSNLSLGATWDPQLAEQVGEILGQEISLLGVNLLLGPSLDVLEAPSPESQGDLGTRSFGGDPFWVGQLGEAYVSGVHTGSEGKVAVIAKHFPGHGGSDRLPDEEVATVRKSLEQLKQIELAPFFQVTGNASSTDGTVDGLMTSHIRYQGLQGNIRATTNPISFDPQAFERIMSLEPFVVWREAGGVIMTDDLGSRAVRRFYDPEGQNFNGHLVALNAFLAGNDLLYLGDILSSTDPDNTTTVLRTLEFFAQKYSDDQAFAQRVDEAVLRILSLKYRLFSSFTLTEISTSAARLDEIGGEEEKAFEVARDSATLISPLVSELDEVIPEPPALNDRIIFFVDSGEAQQCSACPPEPILTTTSLEDSVVSLYGPDAGDRILPYNLASFSFEALDNVLESAPSDSLIERILRQADWVVFVMRGLDPGRPSSDVLRRFLDEQPNLYRNKKLIVFALDVPYLLDATDISKLTAYYGLFSKTPQFIEVAARLLFKEIQPITGALPVSVPGVGYDLITATSPDPLEVIPLTWISPQAEVQEDEPTGAEGTAVPPPAPEVKLGDSVVVRAGVILDHNGNPVPDQTPVDFVMTIDGQESRSQVETTRMGVAETTFLIDRTGNLAISARSGIPPASSNVLLVSLPGEAEAGATLVPPTETTVPTEMPSPTPLPPTPTSTPEAPLVGHLETDFGDWLLALGIAGAVGIIAYRVGTNNESLRWGFRWAVCAIIGGLVVYTGLSLQLPPAGWLMEQGGRWAVIWLSLLGAGVGWGLGIIWRSLNQRRV
jgi:beta-N-acetylhexosaminidase